MLTLPIGTTQAGLFTDRETLRLIRHSRFICYFRILVFNEAVNSYLIANLSLCRICCCLLCWILLLIVINISIMILSIALIWAVLVGFCCLLWLAVGIRHR